MVGGGFELVAKAINLGLRGTGREDAADGRVRTGHDLLDGRDVAIGEQRRGFFPELAVLILDAAQEQPTLDGDRDAERQHDRDRVHHETALLEEVEEGDEEIHVACPRSEEHTSELQSLMRISYAVFCLKKKNTRNTCT